MSRRTDKELAAWADEHLVYEAQQLRFAAERLAALGDREAPERNMAIESFAIHTRCLLEFLWGKPKKANDLRALHFCADWHTSGLPHLLSGVGARIDKEIVHLTYGRQLVAKEAKGWKFDAIYKAVTARLEEFARSALPERLAESTRRELSEFSAQPWRCGSESTVAVATTASYDSVQAVASEPGTIRFPPGAPLNRR